MLQDASTKKLLWTVVTALPALLGVGAFVSYLPMFVAEHASLGGAGRSPLGSLAADVALGLLFGVVAAFALGHLAVWIAYTLRPFIWVMTVFCICHE
jgi:hypothetical protein